jgi:radical SAM-linked protein
MPTDTKNQRVRLRFRKHGDLRWISHHDLMRTVERLFRRAALRLGLSQGFHPKARLMFPSALALGVEGWDEVLEFELAEHGDAEQLAVRLAAQAPAGLTITHVQCLPPGAAKARVRRMTYRITVPEARRADLESRLQQFRDQETCWVQRDAGPTTVDVKAGLDQLDFQQGVLQFRLRSQGPVPVRPREVLGVLGLADLEREGWSLARTEVEIEP